MSDFDSFVSESKDAELKAAEEAQLAAAEEEETSGLTDALVETMLKNPDPKFQNSKFLKFVTQLNNGEVR